MKIIELKGKEYNISFEDVREGSRSEEEKHKPFSFYSIFWWMGVGQILSEREGRITFKFFTPDSRRRPETFEEFLNSYMGNGNEVLNPPKLANPFLVVDDLASQIIEIIEERKKNTGEFNDSLLPHVTIPWRNSKDLKRLIRNGALFDYEGQRYIPLNDPFIDLERKKKIDDQSLVMEELLEVFRKRAKRYPCRWCGGTKKIEVGNCEAADQGSSYYSCGHCSDGYSGTICEEDQALIQKVEKTLLVA